MTPTEDMSSVGVFVFLDTILDLSYFTIHGGIIMATSLAILIIFGLFFNFIFTKIKLPGFVGMLILGVLVGPYAFDLLDPNLLVASEDFRKIALIIILLRAGLGISRDSLNKVGPTAIKMSCIPGIFEGLTIAFISTKFLGFSFIQGGILGFIIAAVSPAVVVPMMLNMIERQIGTKNNIPTLILASASIDDVVAITIFTTFMGLYSGSELNIGIQLAHIPLSILLGILSGIVLGFLLVYLFKKFSIRDTKKVLIILGAAIFLTTIESALKSKIEIAALLGVMTIGFILLEKLPYVAERLSAKFNKIWVFAEMLLFVLVGAQVNIYVAKDSGLVGIAIIFIGLIARSIGVLISTATRKYSWKERFFCMIAYTPKATVQAAIGAIPLSFGVASGDVILSIAVLSILITAPLGAIGIRKAIPKLIE